MLFKLLENMFQYLPALCYGVFYSCGTLGSILVPPYSIIDSKHPWLWKFIDHNFFSLLFGIPLAGIAYAWASVLLNFGSFIVQGQDFSSIIYPLPGHYVVGVMLINHGFISLWSHMVKP